MDVQGRGQPAIQFPLMQENIAQPVSPSSNFPITENSGPSGGVSLVRDAAAIVQQNVVMSNSAGSGSSVGSSASGSTSDAFNASNNTTDDTKPASGDNGPVQRWSESIYQAGRQNFLQGNYIVAMRYYDKAIEMGHIHAMVQKGVLYECGHGVVADNQQAFKWYQRAAHQKDPLALEKLGSCYQLGTGVKQDFRKAVDYFQQAEKLGRRSATDKLYDLFLECFSINTLAPDDTNGLFILGWLYEKGAGVACDVSKAIEYYERAADKRNSNAQLQLARLYRMGEGVKPDPKKAWDYYQQAGKSNAEAKFELAQIGEGIIKLEFKNAQTNAQTDAQIFQHYKEAADGGNVNAIFRLGEIFVRGDLGKARDPVLGASYWQQAGELGHVRAIEMIIGLYDTGMKGLPKNLATAIKYAELNCMEYGNVESAYRLWKVYDQGIKGVNPDPVKALKFLMFAAQRNDARALHNLAFKYYAGVGVTKHPTLALACYQQAAQLGIADAIYSLSVFHYSGQLGLPVNYQESFRLCEQAAKLDVLQAQFALGLYYEQGVGTDINLEKAYQCFLEITEDKDPKPEYLANLGRVYEYGIGTKKSAEKAFRLYRRAADQGNLDGLFAMGRCFEEGIHVKANPKEAFKYYCQAAKAEVPSPFHVSYVGRAYEFGIGIAPDPKQAFNWYLKSANMPGATSNLFANMARVYQLGIGVERDINQENQWAAKAGLR